MKLIIAIAAVLLCCCGGRADQPPCPDASTTDGAPIVWPDSNQVYPACEMAVTEEQCTALDTVFVLDCVWLTDECVSQDH